MIKRKRNIAWVLIGCGLLSGAILTACSGNGSNKNALFEVLDADRTGIRFVNKLSATGDFNIFNYMYFYNGAGLGAGDFNNDGLVDLFFGSNQGLNSLYLNKGGLRFEDVTGRTGIPADGGWSTGVSVVDINNDGLLDVYVCRVGNYEVLRSKNQFLICQGIDKDGVPHYKDQAAELGLDFSGFSTQAVFFDYDLDGDLDMFLLNHAVHQNGSFAPRSNFQESYSLLSGDRMYRNDGGHFTDVTRESRIFSTPISYGLGVVAADINLDGWPDLYVGNDFHENDYLYINQHDGTFREEGGEELMHTSKFSMGVDAGDLNNDGYPEIVSMDMLPADPYILKRSLGDDDYDVFYRKIAAGYHYQYARNNLQYNRRNGHFSETGVYSGVDATDWSWASLLADFDNDGLKDLFIANGIPKRMNDMDFINFISNEEMQRKINSRQMDDKNMALVRKFPEIKIPNKFYHNTGNLLFQDIADSIGNDRPSYSNGAVYADFDNDGDLDIAVNNIDDAAYVYENRLDKRQPGKSTRIVLQGPATNRQAIGARLVLYSGESILCYDNFPVRGFQSSMLAPMVIPRLSQPYDSAFLIWPDNSFQPFHPNGALADTFRYTAGLPAFNFSHILNFYKQASRPAEDISEATGLRYLHRENYFQEFNREPLIPHWLSTEGPALAVADVNRDGLDDVFIGGSRGNHSGLFLQTAAGKFTPLRVPALWQDSSFEDVAAVWADLDGDGNQDLAVASGGNEFFGQDTMLKPRVYLGDGKSGWVKKTDAFGNIFLNASCIAAEDFDRDGDVDLFIGARNVPWAYGDTPHSYLLINDGKGRFSEAAATLAPGLADIGLVTGVAWCDLNGDGIKELVISCEWGGIYAFVNNQGQWKREVLCGKTGWWNFVMPVDVNGDGKTDLVAGNLGLNSRLRATDQQPVRMYVNDFDDNGHRDQVVTYYVNGKEVTLDNKDELEKQMPGMKKRFLYAEDFAKSSLHDILPAGKLESSLILQANYMSSAVLINKGNFQFSLNALPWEAQLSTCRDATVVDANGDQLPDLLLAGNYYDNSIHLGRNDADFGTLLINRGNGNWETSVLQGVQLTGQVRHLQPLRMPSQPNSFVLARNNDSARVIRFR